jgi:bis(5'-adenosyl)-triphosphatase
MKLISYLFGPYPLHTSQIFLETTHCLGIVNLKPIVEGHVLIISKRVLPRLVDLTMEESRDFFDTVKKCAPVLEKYYNAEALNIAIQDGSAAGQSVPHIHCHILPRRTGDFERNDDVYTHLENQKLDEAMSSQQVQIDPKAERKPRTIEKMAEESSVLRSLFETQNLLEVGDI